MPEIKPKPNCYHWVCDACNKKSIYFGDRWTATQAAKREGWTYTTHKKQPRGFYRKLKCKTCNMKEKTNENT